MFFKVENLCCINSLNVKCLTLLQVFLLLLFERCSVFLLQLPILPIITAGFHSISKLFSSQFWVIQNLGSFGKGLPPTQTPPKITSEMGNSEGLFFSWIHYSRMFITLADNVKILFISTTPSSRSFGRSFGVCYIKMICSSKKYHYLFHVCKEEPRTRLHYMLSIKQKKRWKFLAKYYYQKHKSTLSYWK